MLFLFLLTNGIIVVALDNAVNANVNVILSMFGSRPGDVYRVVLGEHNLSVHEGTEQTRDVMRIVVHPNWDLDFVARG